ncbi:ABC transporter ATP-binding protein [Chelatococcus reniformis]|uniref:ABC transporter ATP-binding protein n=1 Tax=Chelatococcus reniformis TaxID=1494448 RepID=UPI0016651B67|nr:ABC transporter ATP-binding protein [Chelatococcus reniformis]
MLEVHGLTAGYGTVPVLSEVSLEVRQGELVGLLGANNAGKSTLIQSLSGLVMPSAGRIVFAGEDVTRLGPAERVARGIVQVPEGRLVFPQMSVRDNLLLGGINGRARPARPERLERVLTLFPRLKERLGQDAGTLSGGEQQMLAIGRGLMADGRLLTLDEPSLGLSPLFVQYIFEIIRQLSADGLTILLVEQNSGLTFRHAARCYVLERGRVVVSGDSATVKADPATRKAYLGL